jgi:hypothetical protein
MSLPIFSVFVTNDEARAQTAVDADIIASLQQVLDTHKVELVAVANYGGRLLRPSVEPAAPKIGLTIQLRVVANPGTIVDATRAVHAFAVVLSTRISSGYITCTLVRDHFTLDTPQ